MKALLQRLEPLIWLLFSGGMMVGAMFFPAYLLVVGVAMPLGYVPEGALAYTRALELAATPLGRLLLLALGALPLWGGAHHLRHLWIDFGGLKSDTLVATLLYGVALVGSGFAVYAVARL